MIPQRPQRRQQTESPPSCATTHPGASSPRRGRDGAAPLLPASAMRYVRELQRRQRQQSHPRAPHACACVLQTSSSQVLPSTRTPRRARRDGGGGGAGDVGGGDGGPIRCALRRGRWTSEERERERRPQDDDDPPRLLHSQPPHPHHRCSSAWPSWQPFPRRHRWQTAHAGECPRPPSMRHGGAAAVVDDVGDDDEGATWDATQGWTPVATLPPLPRLQRPPAHEPFHAARRPHL